MKIHYTMMILVILKITYKQNEKWLYKENNIEKPLNDKKYDCYFAKNSNRHIAVKESKTWLTKFLSNFDSDKFCLNSFCNFQRDEMLKSKWFVNIMITLIFY